MFDINLYELGLLVVGIAMLASVWLPQVIFGRSALFAVVPLLVGVLFFGFVPHADGLLLPDPMTDRGQLIWEKLTEAAVVISLVGAGLRISKQSWRQWSATIRLLALVMPLTIGMVALLGVWWAGLPLATAVLLGAVLAPTDPVLASDVQAENAHDDEHDVRFIVTSEAGLNDGLAFPFTYLAIALALSGGFTSGLVWEWLWWDLVGRSVIAVAAGAGVGWVIGKVIHRSSRHQSLAGSDLGSLALCMFFIAYGFTELLHGYGFIAAFVSAVVVRREDYDHKFNESMAQFIGNLEHVLIAILLLLLGGVALSLLPFFSWPLLAIGLALVFVVRPMVAWLSLTGHGAPRHHKAMISWFGVRGVGTVYYAAYALGQADFAQSSAVWVVGLWTLLLSVLVHGLSATPAMRWLEQHEGVAREDDKKS